MAMFGIYPKFQGCRIFATEHYRIAPVSKRTTGWGSGFVIPAFVWR